MSICITASTYSKNVNASGEGQVTNTQQVTDNASKATISNEASDDMSVGEHNVNGLKYNFSADGTLTFESGTLPETNRVYGGYPWFNNDKVKKVIIGTKNSKVIANKDSNGLFSNLSNLTSVDFVNVDSSKTTDMGWMFEEDSALQSVNFGNIDTSDVTNMELMFDGDDSLNTVDLSNFDTSNVTNMNSMFSSTGLLSIKFGNKFSTAQVKDMGFMFAWSDKLVNLDLSGFDTGKTTSMSSMFFGDTDLVNIKLANLNTSSVTNMANMFLGDSSLKSLDLSNFDTSKVTTMGSMFMGDTNLEKLNLSNFDTKLAIREYTLTGPSGNTIKYHGMDGMFGDVSQGFPDDKKLSQITLGPNTLLIDSVELTDPTGTDAKPIAFSDPDNPNTIYQNNQNKWQAVGSGSIGNPQGKLYSSKDLISLRSTPQPKTETYIWAHAKTGSGSDSGSNVPPTPTTPTTPVTPSTPTTSSSSSSSSSASSSSSSTPTSSSSSSSSSNTSLPSYVAAKGTVVYSINKIGLYKSTKFSATNRSAWYTKKPRVYRPMFVVTGYKRAANGALRYRVRDVNHTSKTNGKTGYITASQKYVRPVYYATKHSTVTVINPRGVNAYRKANLTKKARSYRQGTVLHVKRIVTHNLTTRYVLTNGDYITANRKLVNMGRHKQVKSVKTKRALNQYSSANFTKKNHVIAKNRTLKVYGYDYSQKNSVTKHGALRYRVAGGYITANTKYVRAYK